MTRLQCIKQTIRPAVQRLSSYASSVNQTAGLIKLDAMENTHSTPQALIERWHEALDQQALNRYPDANQHQLKTQLAGYHQIQPEQLMFGNGSDELIQLLIMSACDATHGVFSVEPCFVMYRMSSIFCNVPYHSIDLDADFKIDVEPTIAAIKRYQPKVVFLAHPNNPTGNAFDLNAIEKIIQVTPGIVVIDEAYGAFAKHSYLPLVLNYDNVVVLRTFSKLGLAGLRLGYMVAHPDWVEQFNKIRMPYNIDSLAQAFLTAWLDMPETLIEQAQSICEQRGVLANALASHDSVACVFPSQTNFLLVRFTPDRSASSIYQVLLDSGILVKDLSQQYPSLHQCLRISIGTASENQQLIKTFNQI